MGIKEGKRGWGVVDREKERIGGEREREKRETKREKEGREIT